MAVISSNYKAGNQIETKKSLRNHKVLIPVAEKREEGSCSAHQFL